jgi:hypothetical protein
MPLIHFQTLTVSKIKANENTQLEGGADFMDYFALSRKKYASVSKLYISKKVMIMSNASLTVLELS